VVLTSASIGASIYPQHGDSYEALRRCADSAMYHAKHQRKGSASYYELAADSGLTARMALEQRLRVAIRERHFRAAFQAKVDLQTGRTEGFEALARWVEPDGTVHLPGKFIDLATELGLLDEITRFVLDDVARSLPQLISQYGSDTSVSINVGARQAGDSVFMNSFIQQLVATGLARRIVVELTEDAVMATQHFQRRVLPALRQIGVRVSIDDFGTGFSSLSTLADITADEVKVDRAFITDIHLRVRSQVILKAIESLCVALEITTVAEGVETAEELAYLRANTTIRFAQGYLFAKPLFLEALMAGTGDDAQRSLLPPAAA
jgi:c-di-GMP phosphodiesterase Gmr